MTDVVTFDLSMECDGNDDNDKENEQEIELDDKGVSEGPEDVEPEVDPLTEL